MAGNTASEFARGDTFEDVTEKVEKHGREIGRKVGEAVDKTATELKSVGTKAIDEISKQGSEQFHKLEKLVKDEPMKSLAIAAGLGVLLGALLRR